MTEDERRKLADVADQCSREIARLSTLIPAYVMRTDIGRAMDVLATARDILYELAQESYETRGS